MLEEEVYVDDREFLKASVQWANEMENIIQAKEFDIPDSRMAKNLLVLRREINQKEGQDYSQIYRLMHDIKSDYEEYAKRGETDSGNPNEKYSSEDEIRLKPNNELETICSEFAQAVSGKGTVNNGVCSVNLHRQFKVEVEGKTSSSVVPASIVFESLDTEGNALNLAEIAIFFEELSLLVKKVTQEGLIVSAIHNHWIYTNPVIMYVHIQSVEPPVLFAEKMAKAFSALSSEPIQK